MIKVSAWIIVLGVLWILNMDGHSLLQAINNTVNNYNNAELIIIATNMGIFQFFVHAIVVIAAVLLRFVLWVLVGMRFEQWLSEFFTNKVIGEEQTKVILEYIDKVVADVGWLPAFNKIFSAFSK